MFKRDFEFYWLPSLITYGNLILSLLAASLYMIYSEKMFLEANILLILAACLDKLDGFVARKLDMETEFGKQLDSLVDLVSFALVPIYLAMSFLGSRLSIFNYIAGIIYIISSIYRLARFNILKANSYFIGLPITLAGLFIAIVNIVNIYFLLSRRVYSLIFITLSILMISNIKIKKPYN